MGALVLFFSSMVLEVSRTNYFFKWGFYCKAQETQKQKNWAAKQKQVD